MMAEGEEELRTQPALDKEQVSPRRTFLSHV